MGEVVSLACSACKAKLVDIVVIKPDAIDPVTGKIFEWKVAAQCCFCGDRSFEQTIAGRYRYFGHGIPKDDDPGEARMLTQVTGVVEDGNRVVFQTAKAQT